MSTKRIRRKGPNGKDIILDADLGPATPYNGGRAASGAALASPVGHMQPVMRGGTYRLRSRRDGGGWAASRAFTINSKKRRPGQPWQEPRQNNP
ncbi:hypothetical protein BH23CHL8_BH23CHL8_24250 [soil metagenome]